MDQSVAATAASSSMAVASSSSSSPSGSTSNSSSSLALPIIVYPAPRYPTSELRASTIMLALPEREYRDAKTAAAETKQFALDHGYSAKVEGSVIRCSRSGQPKGTSGAQSDKSRRQSSKTNCPFEAALVKTANGVKVTVKHADHNHDIDREIGINYWAVLTKEEKQVVKAMKLADASLQVGQVKDVINRVRAQKGLPALKDSGSISNLFQYLKRAPVRGSAPRDSPPRDSPARGSSTRFGPAAATIDPITPEATVALNTIPAPPAGASPSVSLSPPGSPDHSSQVLSDNLRMEGQFDAIYHELDELRPQFSHLFASSSAFSFDPACVARRGFAAMVGEMLLQRDEAS